MVLMESLLTSGKMKSLKVQGSVLNFILFIVILYDCSNLSCGHSYAKWNQIITIATRSCTLATILSPLFTITLENHISLASSK